MRGFAFYSTSRLPITARLFPAKWRSAGYAVRSCPRNGLFLVLLGALLSFNVCIETARAQETMSSGWYYPTGTSNLGSYLAFLGYNSKTYPYHLAKDIKNAQGNPVYSLGDGEIIESRTDVSGYGRNYVKGGALIARYQAADGTWFTALYGHLDRPHGKGFVRAGEAIGVSNNFSPPHLHFAIHPGRDAAAPNPWRGYTESKSNTYGFVDPFPFLAAHPRSQPVSAPPPPAQPPPVPPVPNKAPIGAFDGPAEGSTLTGPTDIFGWALDPDGNPVNNLAVRLFLDDQELGVSYPEPKQRDDGNPGFMRRGWNPATASVGEHTLRLILVDEKGATAEIRRRIRVERPPAPAPSKEPTFSSAVTTSPETPGLGQVITIATQVTCKGGPLANAIVDVEIWDAAGGKIKQFPHENVSFAFGASKSFTDTWTMPTAGTYIVKVGVFGPPSPTGVWGKLYNDWNDRAATFTVADGVINPAPGGAPYTFETGEQGWTYSAEPASGLTIAGVRSTGDKVFRGQHSLAIQITAQGVGKQHVFIKSPPVPPGARITFNVWIPVDCGLKFLQPFAVEDERSNPPYRWTGEQREVANLRAGEWNAIQVTVPANAVLPLHKVGIEFEADKPWTGVCYVDEVGWP